VIVQQLKIEDAAIFKAEDHAPVGLHRDCPETLAAALEGMQAVTRDGDVQDGFGLIQNGQNVFNRLDQVGPNLASVPPARTASSGPYVEN